MQILQEGNLRRTQEETMANKTSSRSHALLQARFNLWFTLRPRTWFLCLFGKREKEKKIWRSSRKVREYEGGSGEIGYGKKTNLRGWGGVDWIREVSRVQITFLHLRFSRDCVCFDRKVNFQVMIVKNQTLHSKLFMIDLAGSERASNTQVRISLSYSHLENVHFTLEPRYPAEGRSGNKSLVAGTWECH